MSVVITNQLKHLIVDIDGTITLVKKLTDGVYPTISHNNGTIAINEIRFPYNRVKTPDTTSERQLVTRLLVWCEEAEKPVASTDLIEIPLEIVEATTVGTTGDGKRYLPIGPKLHNTRIDRVLPFHITAGSGSDTDITIQRLRPASATTWTTTEIVSTTCTAEIKDGELWGWDKDYVDANGDAANYSSAANPCIDPDNAKLLLGDMLKINIDTWMTNAQGLIIDLSLRPL